MSSDSLTLLELAKLLNRDARTLEKQAEQGKLPGKRISGAWKFHRSEVQDWLEQQIGELNDRQLEDVERGIGGQTPQPATLPMLVSPCLTLETISVNMDARTARGVLQKLVDIANGNWQVYTPQEVYDAVRQREELCSTALPGGIAIPHPRRPNPDSLGDHVIAFGRTSTGIPFAGPENLLCDLFFLVLCRDEKMHLQVLSRLARMILRQGFLESLRAAHSAEQILAVIQATESDVIGQTT